jgi:hypothetical protein
MEEPVPVKMDPFAGPDYKIKIFANVVAQGYSTATIPAGLAINMILLSLQWCSTTAVYSETMCVCMYVHTHVDT